MAEKECSQCNQIDIVMPNGLCSWCNIQNQKDIEFPKMMKAERCQYDILISDELCIQCHREIKRRDILNNLKTKIDFKTFKD